MTLTEQAGIVAAFAGAWPVDVLVYAGSHAQALDVMHALQAALPWRRVGAWSMQGYASVVRVHWPGRGAVELVGLSLDRVYLLADPDAEERQEIRYRLVRNGGTIEDLRGYA